MAALAVPSFRWWFLSQITSSSGLMTQSVATSWLVLKMTGRGFDLALLSAATMLPVLCGSAWAGALVDRIDRRRLLIATQSSLTVLSGVLFVLIASGAARYRSIVAVSVASGLVNAFDGPARQVYVLDLVGRDRLAGAVSLYEVILNTSRVLGPGLGGLFLALLGPAACVLANGVSFLAPIAVLIRYRTKATAAVVEIGAAEPSDPAQGSSTRPRKGKGAARAGLRYAWSIPAIRACLLLAAACGILFNPAVLFPLLAVQSFHLSGGGYGALTAAFGIGALPGALLAARGGGEPTGRQVGWLAVATGLCVAVTAYAPNLPLVFLGMGATGMASIWMIARANTLVQLRADPAMRGRVMGAWTMALPGMSPVTSIAAGPLADAAGARAAFAAAGLLIAGITLAGWRGLTSGAAPRSAG
jgi:MFS family permease